MAQSEIVLYCIKLVLGGIAAFFAIMLWSKTRDSSWMSLVASVVTAYAGVVYEMMIKLGIVVESSFLVFGIPVVTLIFTIVPPVFLILAFVLMVIRNF
jgi:hypothetical protein